MKGSEIKNLVFSISIMGYKKSDVKVCLKEISEYVLKLENKLYNAEVERDKLKDKLNKSEMNQVNFKEIIASAQEFKSRIESESQKKANEVVQKAKNEAKEILVKSQKQYEEIVKAIKSEKAKFGIIKRDLEGVKNTIVGKLGDFVSILDFKERNNGLSRDTIPFRTEQNDSFVQNFEPEKSTSRLTQENEKADSPVEVKENIKLKEPAYASKNKEADSDYIKARFNEIELR